MLFLTLLVAMNANAQGSAGTWVDPKTKSLAEFRDLCEPDIVRPEDLSAYSSAQARLDAWRRDIPGLADFCLDEVFEWPWLRPTKRNCKKIKSDPDSGLVQSVEKHGSYMVITPLYDAQNETDQQRSHVHEAARHCVDKLGKPSFSCMGNPECHPDIQKEDEKAWKKHERKVKELSVNLWIGYESNSDVKASMLEKVLGSRFVGRERLSKFFKVRMIPEQLAVCELIEADAGHSTIKDAMLAIRKVTKGAGPSYWNTSYQAQQLFSMVRLFDYKNLFHHHRPLSNFHTTVGVAISGSRHRYDAFIGEDWDQRIADYTQACTNLSHSPEAIALIRNETPPSLVQTQVETPAPTRAVAHGRNKETRGVLLPGTNSTRRMGGR